MNPIHGGKIYSPWGGDGLVCLDSSASVGGGKYCHNGDMSFAPTSSASTSSERLSCVATIIPIAARIAAPPEIANLQEIA
jgi:hypothetical protein